MNKNNNNLYHNGFNLDNGNQSAKLAVIGGAISTLGDAISTLAAVLALEEASQGQNDNDNNDMKDMKKQIKYLTNELNKLKSSSNKKSENRGF